MLRAAKMVALSCAALATACSFDGAPVAATIDAALPTVDAAMFDAEPDAASSCDPTVGEPLFGASSYRVIPTEMTFDQAAAECDLTDERLAVLETQDEHRAISDHLVLNGFVGRDCQDNGNSACAWIGLRQALGAATPSDNWRWADGSLNDPASAAFGWPGDEPNDDNDVEDGSEDCAQLRASDLDWNDKACASLMPAVCECDPT